MSVQMLPFVHECQARAFKVRLQSALKQRLLLESHQDDTVAQLLLYPRRHHMLQPTQDNQ